MVMLGLAVSLLPKASWAGDVSMRVFFGIPCPVFAIAPAPPIHHPGAGFFVSPPLHHRGYAYGKYFRGQKHFRDNDHRGYRYGDNGRRDNGKRDNQRGNYERRDNGRGYGQHR